jgi:hypothetical protein
MPVVSIKFGGRNFEIGCDCYNCITIQTALILQDQLKDQDGKERVIIHLPMNNLLNIKRKQKTLTKQQQETFSKIAGIAYGVMVGAGYSPYDDNGCCHTSITLEWVKKPTGVDETSIE